MILKKKIYLGILISIALMGIGIYLFIQSITFPTSKEVGLQYKTTHAINIPENLKWQSAGFAKELINQKENMVVISGGNNTISNEKWKDFKPRFPWSKNIDRHILFEKVFFAKSPYASIDCQNDNCKTIREYQEYTWNRIGTTNCSRLYSR